MNSLSEHSGQQVESKKKYFITPIIIMVGAISLMVAIWSFLKASNLQTQMRPKEDEYTRIAKEYNFGNERIAARSQEVINKSGTGRVNSSEYLEFLSKEMTAQEELLAKLEVIKAELRPLGLSIGRYNLSAYITFGVGVILLGIPLFRFLHKKSAPENLFSLSDEK